MAERAGVVPQLLGVAVGIVLGAVLLFTLLGMLRDGEPTPEVVADPTPTATVEEPTEESDEPVASPSETPSESEPAPSEEPSPDPTPTETPPPTDVDPAEVSIQVLDAVGGDDGPAAAQAVAEELRGAGYDVVVVNRAGRLYDVTTVFWSEGQAASGQQVAATLGTSEAEQTPEAVQLSDSVDVHVVVGADRA